MKFSFLFFFVLFSNFVFSQTVTGIDTSKGIKIFPIIKNVSFSNDSIPKVIVSNGYWSWEVTSDPIVNELNMQKAKIRFKSEHPDLYEKIVCDQNVITNIDYLEFQNASPEKKAFFLSHPELYKIMQRN